MTPFCFFLLIWMLSIVFASAIFHFIESPIRRRQILATGIRIIQAYTFSLGSTIVICAVVFFSNGLPWRFSPEVVRLASFSTDRSPELKECQFEGQQLSEVESYCKIGAKDSPVTWMIYGDSHAWAAYSAFDKWLRRSGQAGLFLFRHSCPPLIGISLYQDTMCATFNVRVVSFLTQRSEISNVLLVSTWRQAIEGRLTISSETPATIGESTKLFRAQFAATLEVLHTAKKDVYIWEPVPGAMQNVPLALANATLRHETAKLEFDRREYLQTFNFFFEALDENRALVKATISPSDALCQSGRCSATIEGNPAYFDNAHLAASTADFWANVLGASIQVPSP